MYPHTIDDQHGSRLTFLGVSNDRLEVSGSVDPGAGPPMHIHHLQSETLTVQSGRIGYLVAGEPERFAGPGETAHFPAGVPHRFWNAGDTEAVVTGSASPPNNMEWFLTQTYASIAAHGGRPSTLDGAYLMTRYRHEFEITDIPLPVRRFVFPVIAFLGRVFGRYGHFADAPKPVQSTPSATLPGRSATSARSSAG